MVAQNRMVQALSGGTRVRNTVEKTPRLDEDEQEGYRSDAH